MADEFPPRIRGFLNLLLPTLPLHYRILPFLRRPLPLEELQNLLVPLILTLNCARVGVVVFEGCDDERSIFIWHVEFHAYSLGSPAPQLLPGLDQLLYGLGRRNSLALHPALFPGSIIEIPNSVFAEPGQVLTQLLKLFLG